MSELLIVLIAFIALIILVIWLHFFKQKSHVSDVDNRFRDQMNIDLYHEHKAEIEKDFEQKNIDEESYQYLLTELNQSLLQDIEENKAEQEGSASSKPLSIMWPAFLTLFVIGFSGYYYHQQGAYQQIVSQPKQSTNEQLSVQQQQAAQLAQFKQQLTLTPDNSDLWYSYGQALVSVGEFSKAQEAFDTVLAIEGEKADVYGVKAQASYYQNNQQITADVQQYIDKALALDAKEPSTNILLGMDHFLREEFEQAISYWQLVVNDNRENVNVVALQNAITEAQRRLPQNAQPSSAENASLSINVSLSEALNNELMEQEDRVVFVYAIPTSGSRMPLAALKLRTSDLPVTITLSDDNAMTPQAKLSQAEQVHVFAIASSTGSAGINPGDYKAQLDNVVVNSKETLNLVIDSVIE
ncbi:c-type cytochrome biogenesis protein CcmI [Thalassotalea ganghwensis]